MKNHFIVTRFNQKFNFFKNSKNLFLNDDWLNYRVDLFLRYSAPSILGQEKGDFYWLIMIDEETPKYIKNKLLIDKRILLCSCGKERKQKVSDLSNPNYKYAFSRIDSDDGYRKDFTNQIHKFDCNKKEFLLDINYICFDINKKIFQQKIKKSSHFITFITENKNFNIYLNNHLKLINLYTYFKINDFLGIEIIHGKNISNKINEKNKIININNLNDYNINYVL